MQDPDTSNAAAATTRKSWYQKAMEMTTIPWKRKTISKPTHVSPNSSCSAPTSWKTISKSTGRNPVPNPTTKLQNLKKCTSLRVATSFTRVCLCVPISSWTSSSSCCTEISRAELPPHYNHSRSRPVSGAAVVVERAHKMARRRNTGISGEGRRVFRGKSLNDDVLMRRFVAQEQAKMQLQATRRGNEMEFITRRSALRGRQLGPSPLRRMVMAGDEGLSSYVLTYN